MLRKCILPNIKYKLIFIFAFMSVVHCNVAYSATSNTVFIPTSLQIANALAEAGVATVNNQKNLQAKESNKKKKYRIGVSFVNAYPLVSFANLEDKGIGWAVLQAFAKQENIEFEYIGMPITRLQPSMDSEAIDFIFPDNPLWTAYRSNRLPNIYSGPIISTVSATFVKTEHQNIDISQVKKVTIPFGYTAYTWIEPIRTYGIRSIPARNLVSALRTVSYNNADAADVEYNIGKYLIQENPSLNNLTINPNLPHISVDYHLSSIKHISVLEKLTKFVKDNPQLIDELKEKYNILYHDEVYNGFSQP